MNRDRQSSARRRKAKRTLAAIDAAITTWCPNCYRKSALSALNGVDRTCRYCGFILTCNAAKDHAEKYREWESKEWRMTSAIGRWHSISRQVAFRIYMRTNRIGQVACFADYRVGDLVSRFHRVKDFREANRVALNLTRTELAKL